MAKIVRGEKRKPFGTNATPTEKAAVYALLKASAKGTLDFSAPISTLFTTAAAESQDATAFLFHPALIRPFPNPTLQKRPLPSLLDVRKRKAQKDALTRLLHKQRKVDAAIFARPFSPTIEALLSFNTLKSHPAFVPDFTPTVATAVQQPTLPPPLPLPKLPGVSATATATAAQQRRRRSAAPATAATAATVALLSSLYPNAQA